MIDKIDKIDAVFTTRTWDYQFFKNGLPIDPFKENVIYYNSSNNPGVAAEMGMIINGKELFVLDVFAGTDIPISFVRPHLVKCDCYINLVGAFLRVATDEEMKILGKAWHIYIKEITRIRERLPESDYTYIPDLMIPWKELHNEKELESTQN